MRAVLLEQQKAKLGEPPVTPPEHDPLAYARVRYLVRLESLVNVGCKFRPEDLPPDVWDQLITLAIERAFVDRLVQQRREKQSKEDRAVNQARATTGVPPPGGNLFPQKKPFR